MNRTSPARAAAFRDAYGVTEAQIEILAAILSARVLGARLGCEPVTRRHLIHLGFTPHQLGNLSDLEKAGFIERVAVADEKRREFWYLATDRAARLLGVAVPRRVIGTFDAAAHAEAMTRRFIERQRAMTAARNQRLRESA